MPVFFYSVLSPVVTVCLSKMWPGKRVSGSYTRRRMICLKVYKSN